MPRRKRRVNSKRNHKPQGRQEDTRTPVTSTSDHKSRQPHCLSYREEGLNCTMSSIVIPAETAVEDMGYSPMTLVIRQAIHKLNSGEEGEPSNPQSNISTPKGDIATSPISEKWTEAAKRRLMQQVTSRALCFLA